MNQFDRTLLALALVTGGWLIPERGGYWRGADGTRLTINSRPAHGRERVARLARSGHLKMVASSKDLVGGLRPEWLSPNRKCYAATELAREIVLADPVFQEQLKETVRGVKLATVETDAPAADSGVTSGDVQRSS